MADVWIRLNVPHWAHEPSMRRVYAQKGDVVHVGSFDSPPDGAYIWIAVSDARRLIAAGQADEINGYNHRVLLDKPPANTAIIDRLDGHLPATYNFVGDRDGVDDHHLNAVWPRLHPETGGFHVAARLWLHKRACDVGTDDDRQRTAAVIGEMRVPLYDTRRVWVRRHPITTRFMEAWRDESGDRDLAFMRVLWQHTDILPYALPPQWGGLEA